MHKVIWYMLIMLVIGSCRSQLQDTKEQDRSISKNDGVTFCKIPLNIGADSLSKLIQYETEVRFKDDYRFSTYDRLAINKFNECLKNGIKIDEALKECQKYLLDKLGSHVYCNYLYLMFNTISITESKNVTICFGFSLPNLRTNTKSIWADSLLDEWAICFYLPYQEDGKLVINYPVLPDCTESFDCGFIFSKQMVIDTLYKSNFLKMGDTFTTELSEDFQSWRCTKKSLGSENVVLVNIYSGLISPVKFSQGVD